MCAKKKTVFKGFHYMHCDDFAKYLSDMSAKGWHFIEWGAGLKFEKGEPEQVVYAVEVFPKASDNDLRPEPDTQEFAEYCEAAGWKFVDAKQKFCIFKMLREDAIALFTPEERVNNALKGSFSGIAIALLVLYGLNAVLQWCRLATLFESNIFSGSFLFAVSIWTVMFFVQLITMLYALGKSINLKRKIRTGKKIYIGSCQNGNYHIKIKDVYVLILIALLLYYFYMMEQTSIVILNVLIIAGTLGFGLLLNKIRPKRDMFVIIQVIYAIVFTISIIFFTMLIFRNKEENSDFEKDLAPLVISDYREWNDAIEDISVHKDKNFLGSKTTCFVLGKKESVYYNIYKSKYTWTLDRIWEEELSGKKFNEEAEDCTAEWGAEKALRNRIGTYYVRYKDSILIFSEDKDVDLLKEQIETILDKLDLR